MRQRCDVLLLVGILGALAVLSVRLVQINTSLRPQLVEIAARQHRGTLSIPARRGMIFDRRGRVLALSRQIPDVFVDPGLINDADAVAEVLSVRLNQPAQRIAERIRKYRPDPAAPATSRFVVLARQVDDVAAQAVSSLGHPAVGLVMRARREYPMGAAMAPLLGWVGRDGSGMEGVELAFESHLRGRDGTRAAIHDARRRALSRSDSPLVLPVDGGHLVLTVDAELQRITEEALNRAVERFEAESGVAIVMSPAGGEVLAMVSLPSFDPAAASTCAPDLRRNRAITDPIEPGSSFKPIIACGALDAAVVSPGEQIDCHMGSHYFGRRLVTDTKPNSLLDLRGIITKSSNIGMGIIAERMGNQRLHETIHRFGIGIATGIGLPGDHPGVVRPLSEWTSYSTTSVAMGYEVLVSPLQLVSAYAAVVNGGEYVQPRVVSELRSDRGELVQSSDQPKVVGRATSSKTARYIARECLVSAVAEGGGRRAQAGLYRVFGKTGTAKLAYADRRGYEPGAYLSVFVGAAPLKDPQIVVLAMVRRPNPSVGYYGADVAAPVAGEIIAKALAYMEVAPDMEAPASSL